MLDKPDATPNARYKTVMYFRTILASLLISIGGMIAFAVWTLPYLTQHSAGGATFLTYILAFVPTFFVIATLLLACIVWWLLADRSSVSDSQVQAASILTEPQKEQAQQSRPLTADIPTTTASSSIPQRHYTRHTSAQALRKQRTRHFSTGRIYKGKVRKTALSHLDAALGNPVIMPTNVQEETIFMSISKSAEPQIYKGDDVADATPYVESSPSSIPAEFVPSSSYHTVAMPALEPPIAIFLLKEVTIEIQNARGEKRVVPLRRKRRDDGRYIERDLLAYLASWRGQPVGRDKLLEAVFGYGLSDEKYSLTNLTNQFNKCTQFLRRDINQVASELKLPELTVIASYRDEWRLLSEECRVVDLTEVERLSLKLQGLSGEDFLKPEIQEVCQALIAIYRGDFCEHYIEDTVRDGGQDWVNNWMRDPYTSYRDKYFHALWYRAEYWRVKADLANRTSEAERTLQRNWYELAAKLYQDYALHVPTNFTNESAMLFDSKVSQRTSLGERALRACLDMYTATKNTQAGDAAYLTFARRMGTLTQGSWKPRADTTEAWKNVREQTKSHRFAPRVMPHDLPPEET